MAVSWDALADEFELAWTPDLLAETELACEADAPVCMSAELWARHMAESKAPVSSEAMVLFMSSPPETLNSGPPPEYRAEGLIRECEVQSVFHRVGSYG